MLRDRYRHMSVFDLMPQANLSMEPELAQMDTLLGDDTLFQMVRADLAKRYPHTTTDGRPSTPVEVVLRVLVVKHLFGWSYEETECWVRDSLSLRQFCRVYLEAVPDDTTLLRWVDLIQPKTLHDLLDHVLHLAQSLKVTRGRKLRTDGTVVETNIHHPTDSTLLNDGVRVLSRTLKKAQTVLKDIPSISNAVFRERTRTARRGEEADQTRKATYRQLLAVTRATVRQARQAETALKEAGTHTSQKLAQRLGDMVVLVERVIDQATRRVLQGQKVPATEKLVSLFEPHTAIIRKGKIQRPTEFGRAIWLDEVDGGLISRYDVLDGNPGDAEQLKPSLDHHVAVFGKPPGLVTADRGVYSSANEEYCLAQGVKHVALPKPGAKSAEREAHEKQGWFRRGYAWRSGSEGRISLLKRCFGLARCLYHGDAGMERWVGWGVIAHDLRVIVRATGH